MASSSQTATHSLRIDAEDFKRRSESGEAATILDVRNPKVWSASNVKVRGAVRFDPHNLQIDPGWPKDQLTVVY
jgi:hypothetical protein